MSENNVRRSAVVSTSGVGTLLDFPDAAALVLGLEFWVGEQARKADGTPYIDHPNAGPVIKAPDLAKRLAKRLNVPSLDLRYPPRRDDLIPADRAGVHTRRFPTWFLADVGQSGTRRLVTHRDVKLDKRGRTEFKARPSSKAVPAIPIRFVQACPNGHIDDIDWGLIAHGGQATCGGELWLDERGNTGDLVDTWVRCAGCGSKQPLTALQPSDGGGLLGPCTGRRPWLDDAEPCDAGGTGKAFASHLLVRHASNATFTLTDRGIVIPDLPSAAAEAVDRAWDELENLEDASDVAFMRKKVKSVAAALSGFTDEAVFTEIERRRKPGTAGTPLAKEAKAFLSAENEHGEDPPDADFTAARWPGGAGMYSSRWIERVVLVHRLREVVAHWGFTRIDAPPQPLDGELAMDVSRAPLTAKKETWLPAVENRGEGVFVRLDEDAVRSWLARDAVKARAAELHSVFLRAGLQPKGYRADDVAKYVLLHTFSHLLLTAISLECGYSSASIRERIYALPDCAGVLLYTASADAEGTLGGLVESGRRIERFVEIALEQGRLCSNDPVCASHAPNTGDERTVHGAACHGCVLVSESSCEQRNHLLDRALVVPTVGSDRELAFFGEVGR